MTLRRIFLKIRPAIERAYETCMHSRIKMEVSNYLNGVRVPYYKMEFLNKVLTFAQTTGHFKSLGRGNLYSHY